MKTRTVRRWRATGIVVGVALVFGVLEALQGRALHPHAPWSLFWRYGLLNTVPSWLILAALFPGIYVVSTRARISRTSWPYAFPLHVVFGLAVVGIQFVLTAVLAHWMYPNLSFGQEMRRFIGIYGIENYFIYWCFVAGIHAFHYQSKLGERELAAARLEALVSQARLHALRAQLDPHFLFNALNAISGMALRDDREKLTRTINSLSEFLRATLDEGAGQEVRLPDEILVLERYLDVQRARFGERLAVDVRVEPGLEQAVVPSLLLQPLVENSISHGAGKKPGLAQIEVVVSRDGDSLRFEIVDNGPGFAPAGSAANGLGIGLSNTRARLEQLYGDAQRVETGNRSQGGARVVVEIPYRTTVSTRVAP